MFEKEAEELFKKKPLGYEMKPELEIYTDGFNDGYNKAKEEMQEQGLALQSDMDKTIEQNISLKEQIEKMKCCEMCKHKNLNWGFSPICEARDNIKIENPLTCKCDKWEIKEKC